MALLTTEGFDWLNAVSTLQYRYPDLYNNTSFTSIVTGRGGQGLSLQVSGVDYTDRCFAFGPWSYFEQGTTTIVGFASCIAHSGGGGASNLLSFNVGPSYSAVANISIYYDTADAKIKIFSNHAALTGSLPSTLLCSGYFAYPGDYQYFYVEIKVVNGTGTSGSVTVRVDGNEVCSNLACNTMPAGTSNWFRIATGRAPITATRIDDLYICDTTGSTNNDFLGPVSVLTIRPDSDIVSTGTPSTGTTRYGVIDEIGYNSSDYLTSSTILGDRDEFGMTNLTPTSGTVFGVNTVAIQTLSETGSGNSKLYIKSNTSETLGAAIPINYGAVKTVQLISEINPDTSNAWTITSVNAMNVGIETA